MNLDEIFMTENASSKIFHLKISALRGHLGVPDTVSEPLIVPLNYLVMYRFKGIPSTWLQKLNASNMSKGIEIVHFGPPDVPLKQLDLDWVWEGHPEPG